MFVFVLVTRKLILMMVIVIDVSDMVGDDNDVLEWHRERDSHSPRV